jgi:hypothetical protein
MAEVPKSPETGPELPAPELPPPILPPVEATPSVYQLNIGLEAPARVELAETPETDFEKRNEKLREDNTSATHTLEEPAAAGMVALSEVLKRRTAAKTTSVAKAKTPQPLSSQPVGKAPSLYKRAIALGFVGAVIISALLIYLLTRP